MFLDALQKAKPSSRNSLLQMLNPNIYEYLFCRNSWLLEASPQLQTGLFAEFELMHFDSTSEIHSILI